MKIRKSHFCLVALMLLTMSVSAQNNPYPEEQENADYAITVKFQGQKPGIRDFINAMYEEPEDEWSSTTSDMWKRFLNNKLKADEKVTLDAQNGFVSFENSYSDEFGETKRIEEICYWNCSDTKHKVVAQNAMVYRDGQPMETEFTGLSFMIYNNATHKLTFSGCSDMGIDVEYEDGLQATTYTLPRVGKDIKIIVHYDNKKEEFTAKWNGLRFNLQK